MFGIDGIANLAKGVVDKVWPDATEKVKLQEVATQVGAEVQQRVIEGTTGQSLAILNNLKDQIATNAADAASTDKYKSYARPTYLYLGALILGARFIAFPLLNAGFGFIHIPLIAMPDESTVMTLVFGLLGIYGTQRTVEKLNNKD